MSIWKKAVSVGTSAALLASLFTAVVAAPVAAAIVGTSAGAVAPGTTSAGTATITLTETAKAALATTGTLTATITPAAPGAGSVTWAGTPVLSAPDSLGASVALVGNALNIKITGHDDNNVETITITGLQVKASSDASPGDVVLIWSDTAALAIYNAFAAPTTVTGTLVSPVGSGISAGVQVKDVTGCGFSIAAAVKFNTNGPDLRTPTFVGPLSAGQQVIDFPAGTSAHLIGETITSDVPQCAFSPAKVTQAAKVTYDSTKTVFPGENNGTAGNIFVTEPVLIAPATYPFLTKSTTITFTIATPGVVFSGTPTSLTSTGNAAFSAPVLAADRKSVTVTVTTAGTVQSALELTNIGFDVASTVAGGTFVDVNVSLSGGLLVTGNPAEPAIVFRGITATAPTPTVYIGENSQATGLVTLTEGSAGFFQSGTGSNNILAVCQTGVDYSFTFAPWAKVTAGDLRLREGDVASPDNIVQGTLNGDCYTWTIWTASTTASTIVIGNADLTTGPLINVDVDQAPGPVVMKVNNGNSLNFDDQLIATVTFAVAAYRNQVVVTALSQPTIPAGANDAVVGNIQIAETGNGQLKAGENICVEVLPSQQGGVFNTIQDVFFNSLLTANLPVATASGGVVISPVNWSGSSCEEQIGNNLPIPPFATTPTAYARSFTFNVFQQSTNGTGKVVISNLHYVTLSGAPNGPVQVSVFGSGGKPTVVEFHSTISNAKIGAAGIANAWIATGLNARAASAFGLGTTVVKRGAYVTIRAKASTVGPSGLAQIWVKTKTTAWHKETTRRVSVDGYLYYSGKVLNLGYRYYKVLFVDDGTSNVVRAFGK